jgi:hypothetical protein
MDKTYTRGQILIYLGGLVQRVLDQALRLGRINERVGTALFRIDKAGVWQAA